MKKKLYCFKTVNDPGTILNLLHHGINIPIWEVFHDYILFDLEHLKASSLVFSKENKIYGHALVYNSQDSEGILFFGFIGVKDDDPELIALLVDQVIKYGKEKGYKIIRGPINLPTIIYGWGFMEEGSRTDLFIAKPTNSPNYPRLFIDKGFKIKMREITWEGVVPRLSSKLLEGYNYRDYNIFHPETWEEVESLKYDFLEIHARNLSPESVITPNQGILFDNYLEFVKAFGNPYMFIFIRYKKTNQLIAAGVCYPNPFRKSKKGILDSIVTYGVAIDEEHRGKGLAMFIAKDMFDTLWENNIRYISAPIESTQVVSTTIVQKFFNYHKARSHIILEYYL